MSHFTTIVALIGIVVVVASLLSGALDRLRIPVVAVFLGLGVLLGPWGLRLVDIGFGSPELHAIATLALALVLFSDAVTLETALLTPHRPLLLRILGPGTLFPAVIMAAAARFLLDVSWPAAAIVGAALASTDPVLLRAVLRSGALPDTTRVALRMEAGMNDVVLLPIVVLSMMLLSGGHGVGASAGVSQDAVWRSALGLFLLGPAMGALVGWAGIKALALVRARVGVRRDYESLYAIGLAFTAFAAAEAVGGSGFVAAFAAGLLIAAQDVELCDCFLEYGEVTAEMMLLLTFVALGTALIWTGLEVIDGRTLLFAGIALVSRTVVLYPVLRGAGVSAADRRLIALLGPRGLSSLLLALLPVFAGVAGAERLFAITSLVVLISVVLHGGGIALFMRARGGSVVEPSAEPAAAPRRAPVPERITIGELRALQANGAPVTIVDARTEKSYLSDPRTAQDAVRLRPEDPVRDAGTQRLNRHATLVVYCA
jgi:sodium/hydrogen antiporter